MPTRQLWGDLPDWSSSALSEFQLNLRPQPVHGATGILSLALEQAQAHLTDFAKGDSFLEQLTFTFGDRFDAKQAIALAQDWRTETFSLLPDLEIRSASELNGAYGAFAAGRDRVYLSEEFLLSHGNTTAGLEAITAVLLEEVGHGVDARLNPIDTPGDEGAIFSRVAQGARLDEPTLQPLRGEDDTVVLALDGEDILLEQATPGINPAFDLIGLTDLRNDPRFTGIDGSGMSVVVIDTGLDQTHPLLRPGYVAGYDLVTGSSNPVDRWEHGTHVAGTIGARDENIGVAPDVNLIGLQVFQNGYASNRRIEDALEWVAANRDRYNIVAVNMSLGNGFFSSPRQASGSILYDDVQRLEAAGVTVVSAAGNFYKNNEYPNAAEPAIFSTLSVGAVWQDGVNRNVYFGDGAVDYTTGGDRIASFSQRLDAPNTLFAPGAFIRSTVPGGRTRNMAGTSMASPMVAGTVALMQEAALQFGDRLLSPAEVTDILRDTADLVYDGDDEDDNVRNSNRSYPRLNVYGAIAEVQQRLGQTFPGPIGLSSDADGTLTSAIPVTNLTVPISASLGSDGAVSVGASDVDLYQFQVSTASPITVTLEADPAQLQEVDTYLRLFNASGQELAADDASGAGEFSQLTAALTPGTYYAGVSGDPNRAYSPSGGGGVAGAMGAYRLRFSTQGSDADGVLTGATAVILESEPQRLSGMIGQDGTTAVPFADVDIYQVQAPGDGKLLLDVDTPYGSGQFVDSYLRVFNASGQELGFNNDGLAVNGVGDRQEFATVSGLVYRNPADPTTWEGHTSDSFLDLAAVQGETYYIAVSGQANRAYAPNSLAKRPLAAESGRYDLAIAFASNDQNGTLTQANQLPALALDGIARLERIGSDRHSRTGALVTVGDRDVDVYRVSSPTAGILDIDIDSYGNPAITDRVDATAFLFDGAGQLLGQADDVAGADPQLRFQMQANTSYYVAIAGYGNRGFDPSQTGSGAAGDTGDYWIAGRLRSSGEVADLTDNTLGSAAVQSVAVGSITTGSLGEDRGFILDGTDVDLYRLAPTDSGVITVRTLAAEAFSADTYLRVFDANGNELAANDDENPITRGSGLQVTVNAGSDYYIGISGAGAQAGSYDPVTGLGATAGSQGSYTLAVMPASTTGTRGITLIGTKLADELVGTEGDDFLKGKKQGDRLTGLGGDDTLIGNGGSDTLLGDAGADWLNGGGRRDTLAGGDGDDTLAGGNGRDTLKGGDGDDILDSGKGRDLLTGGQGRDQFVLQTKRGRDRIRDFDLGQDRIGLSEVRFADLTIEQTRRHTLISLGNTALMRLDGIQAEDLSAADFVNL